MGFKQRGQYEPQDSEDGLNPMRVCELRTLPRVPRQLRVVPRGAPQSEPLDQTAMLTLARCAESTGLDVSELFVSSGFSLKHKSLLLSYVFNLNRGPRAVREMIVSDIRAAIDLGATERAADLLLVLRVFLFEHPEARIPWESKLSRGRRCYEAHRARRSRRRG